MTSVIRTSVLLAAIACSMSCTAQAPASGAKNNASRNSNATTQSGLVATQASNAARWPASSVWQ